MRLYPPTYYYCCFISTPLLLYNLLFYFCWVVQKFW